MRRDVEWWPIVSSPEHVHTIQRRACFSQILFSLPQELKMKRKNNHKIVTLQFCFVFWPFVIGHWPLSLLYVQILMWNETLNYTKQLNTHQLHFGRLSVSSTFSAQQHCGRCCCYGGKRFNGIDVKIETINSTQIVRNSPKIAEIIFSSSRWNHFDSCHFAIALIL